MSRQIHLATRSLLAGGFPLFALWGCGADTTCGSLTEPLVVASVDLAPTTLLLRRGQSRQFRATPLTSCNNPILEATITWSSSDPAVASVSPAGLVTALTPGATTITARSEGKHAEAALSVTAVPVAQVTVSPAPAQVEQGLTVALSATVTDSAGDLMLGQPIVWASSDPSIASVDGSGVVSGVAAGGPVTISATVNTATGTALVTVVHPPPAVLAFSGDPADAVAGEEIIPAVEVTVADRFGSPVVGDTSSITLAIGSNPGGATLGGAFTVKAVNGIATFSDLTLDRSGAGYTLTASAAGLATVTSGTFAVTAGPPVALAYVVQPSSTAAGVDIAPPVQVGVLDGFGNLVTTSSATINIRLGSNPGGSALSGTTTVDAVHGVATFSDLSLNKTGSGYTLQASSTGLASVISQGFAVAPGQPVRLAFTVQPTDTDPLAVISPPVEVSVLDAFGNIVTNSTTAITVGLAVKSGGATLSGTTTRGAVSGVATFDDLSLDKSASDYRLSAGVPGLIGALSDPFDVP